MNSTTKHLAQQIGGQLELQDVKEVEGGENSGWQAELVGDLHLWLRTVDNVVAEAAEILALCSALVDGVALAL